MQQQQTAKEHHQRDRQQHQTDRPRLAHQCIQGQQVRVTIRMDPKSLSLAVPLHWQINQLKCLLATLIPKLTFPMVHFFHDNVEIPGALTLQEVLLRDQDSQCLMREDYPMHFQRGEDRPQEFDSYYAHKMTPLLASMKASPFQPLLHPKYHALHTELVETQEITGQNIKANLQNLMNIHNLINGENRANGNRDHGNRDHGNRNGNVQNGENGNGNGNEGGIGVLGMRLGGGNWFERGGLILFKLFQLLMLWQFAQFVMAHISTEHIFIILAIVFAYFGIDHFQRRRGAGEAGQRREQQQQEGQSQQRQEHPEEGQQQTSARQEYPQEGQQQTQPRQEYPQEGQQHPQEGSAQPQQRQSEGGQPEQRVQNGRQTSEQGKEETEQPLKEGGQHQQHQYHEQHQQPQEQKELGLQEGFIEEKGKDDREIPEDQEALGGHAFTQKQFPTTQAIHNPSKTIEDGDQEKVEEPPAPSREMAVGLRGVRLVVLRGLALLVEGSVSIVMSLFPNWTIQLHLNMMRTFFMAVDPHLQGWRAAGQLGSRSEE